MIDKKQMCQIRKRTEQMNDHWPFSASCNAHETKEQRKWMLLATRSTDQKLLDAVHIIIRYISFYIPEM